jgi:O-antigen/teichoic acid export membrane protein
MVQVVFAVVLMAAFWSGDFYRLWIGPEFLNGDPFPSVAFLLKIILVSVLGIYASAIGCQILTGSGNIRTLSIFVVSEVGLNLIGSLILLKYFGLTGIAISIAVTTAFARIAVFPYLVRWKTGLPVRDYLLSIFGRPVLVGVLLILLILCIRIEGMAADWPHLLLQGALYLIGAFTIIVAVGITNSEREQFLLNPLLRILKGQNYKPREH